MRSSTRQVLQGIALTCALHLLTSCASAKASLAKDREIDELRYDNARKRESLIEVLADAERLRHEAEALEAEKATLVKQVADLGASLRSSNTELAAAVSQRDGFRTKLAEAEKTTERIQTSLDKVKSVASASAGELADLRLKNQELEESVRRLSLSETSLTEENKKVTQEVTELRDELVRTRAVLRSLREGGPEQAGLTALQEQIQRLERQYADLQGEKVALQKRIDGLTAAKEMSEPLAASVLAGAVYRGNPRGLLHELAGLTKERWDNALRGEFTWDYFEFTLMGCASLAILLLFWATLRWMRLRRLTKQVRFLSSRVHELELASITRPLARHDAFAETAEGPGGGPRPDGGSGRARTPSLRRSGFSAVISNKDAKTGISGRGEPGSRTLEDRREPVLAPAAKVEREPPKKDIRKVIGARAWETDEADDTSADDELANTQIISKLDDDDDDDDNPPEPVLTLSSGPPAGAKGSSPPSSPGRSSLSTPSGLSGPSTPSKPSKPSKTEPGASDDVELLAELKAVINKKFDELMK